MNLKVIMFGKLADIAGNTVTVNDVADTDGLISSLNKTYPALTGVKYVIAVNKEVVNSNTSLKEDYVIALLPAFSGG
jgi:sulfur-carrier protein